MCTYALARFSCRHEIWGRRTKLCTIGEDFRNGHIEADCTFRGSHPLKTMQVPQACYSCFKIKALPMLCREKLQAARSVFKERWPEEQPFKAVSSGLPDKLAEEGEDMAIESDKGKQPAESDIKEQVINIPDSKDDAAKPETLIDKVVKPTRLAKKDPVTPVKRKTAPPTSKLTPPKVQAALPTPSSTPPKATPSRLSRLVRPSTKTPEKKKIAGAPKSPAKTPARAESKLPKPGFLRK